MSQVRGGEGGSVGSMELLASSSSLSSSSTGEGEGEGEGEGDGGAVLDSSYRATGYGLSTTKVGDVTVVRVVVRDHNRKRFADVPDPHSVNGSALHATLTGPTTAIHPSIAPTGGDPGLYTVRYRPTEQGVHSLRIFLQGEEVDGSPLRVDVRAEDCDRGTFRKHLPEVCDWMTNGMLPWDPDTAPLWETTLHGNGPYPIHSVPREVAGRPFNAASAKLMVDAVERELNGTGTGTGRLLSSTVGPARTVPHIPSDDGEDDDEEEEENDDGEDDGEDEGSPGDDDDDDDGDWHAHEWKRHDSDDAFQGYLYRKQATLLHSRISMLKSSFTANDDDENDNRNSENGGGQGGRQGGGEGEGEGWGGRGVPPPVLPPASLTSSTSLWQSSSSSRPGAPWKTSEAIMRFKRGGKRAQMPAAAQERAEAREGTQKFSMHDRWKVNGNRAHLTTSWAGMDPYRPKTAGEKIHRVRKDAAA